MTNTTTDRRCKGCGLVPAITQMASHRLACAAWVARTKQQPNGLFGIEDQWGAYDREVTALWYRVIATTMVECGACSHDGTGHHGFCPNR